MSASSNKLGKYQIDSILGRGAIGVVYRAHDPELKQTVAVKTIRKDLIEESQHETVLQRFKNEAITGRRLKHPNIVAIYEFNEDRGVYFIVMEYVHGKRLKDYFQERYPFALEEIVRIMLQILDALAYAHQRGVVHRDINPANIMLTATGQVQITDFGIAKLDSSALTHTGMLMGTPSYMSPEQCLGHTVDARSDVFAAGAVLYELLTGEKAFTAETLMQTIQQVLSVAPVKPSKRRGDLPPRLDAIVQKALDKEPKRRYQNALEFSQALRAAYALTPGPGEEATLISPRPKVVLEYFRSRQWNPAALGGGLAAVALAVFLGWLWITREPARDAGAGNTGTQTQAPSPSSTDSGEAARKAAEAAKRLQAGQAAQQEAKALARERQEAQTSISQLESLLREADTSAQQLERLKADDPALGSLNKGRQAARQTLQALQTQLNQATQSVSLTTARQRAFTTAIQLAQLRAEVDKSVAALEAERQAAEKSRLEAEHKNALAAIKMEFERRQSQVVADALGKELQQAAMVAKRLQSEGAPGSDQTAWAQANTAATAAAQRLASERTKSASPDKLSLAREQAQEAAVRLAETRARLEQDLWRRAAERKAAEEQARLAAEARSQEDQQRKEAERLAADEKAKQDAAGQAQATEPDEKARPEAEQAASETARLEAEEKARLETGKETIEEVKEFEEERRMASNAVNELSEELRLSETLVAEMRQEDLTGRLHAALQQAVTQAHDNTVRLDQESRQAQTSKPLAAARQRAAGSLHKLAQARQRAQEALDKHRAEQQQTQENARLEEDRKAKEQAQHAAEARARREQEQKQQSAKLATDRREAQDLSARLLALERSGNEAAQRLRELNLRGRVAADLDRTLTRVGDAGNELELQLHRDASTPDLAMAVARASEALSRLERARDQAEDALAKAYARQSEAEHSRRAKDPAKADAERYAAEAQAKADEASEKPALTPGNLMGTWCGGGVSMQLSAGSWSFRMSDGFQTSFAVKGYDVISKDSVRVYWRDPQGHDGATDFGNFSANKDQMVQIRGRMSPDNRWNYYNRSLKRCGG